MQRVRLGPGQLCAGGRQGEDSCSGDSGSALMLEVTSQARPYDPRVTQVGMIINQLGKVSKTLVGEAVQIISRTF